MLGNRNRTGAQDATSSRLSCFLRASAAQWLPCRSSRTAIVTSLPQRFACRERSGDRDIERAHPRLHRDQKPGVRGGMDGLGYASRFAAEQQDIVRGKAEIEIGQG